MPKLSTLLDQIDLGTVLLPEFQRGYVWNRDQVRGLMRSLYRGYPVGGLLMWETNASDLAVRGDVVGSGGTHLLLLDGQQRVTSLYGVIRGKPPAFFEGDESAFTGLYFNVEEQIFEFYRPLAMSGNPKWINVAELFKSGPFAFLRQLEDQEDRDRYLERLNQLWQIRERTFNQEQITGADKSVDEVVDIFNRVNSGGTKLSKGDLALAKLCAEWPEARQTMRNALLRWEKAGFSFTLDWLLRNATGVLKGRALFSALDKVRADEFRHGLERSINHVGTVLDAVSGRLGLDHDRVLMGRYAFPVLTRLLELNNGRFADSQHRDRVLYWYVHTAIRGRFTGNTETMLQQDYEALTNGGVDALIDNLGRWRGGNLDIQPHDFDGATRGSRFYPLLYMLTRVNGARDFGSGLELKAELLGKLTSLQVHHIFPKALLRDQYEQRQVNAIANFCFLTQDTNLQVGQRNPREYLAEVQAKHPGVLESQWIPTDPELWEVDRYPDFLEERRLLLAKAAQDFLGGLLYGGRVGGAEHLEPVTVVQEEVDDVRAVQVQELIMALRELGCAEPQVDVEIADPETGRELAIAEAFWPDGLQAGQGEPVVLELNPEQADLVRLEQLGYEVFTSVDALVGFAERRAQRAAGEDQIVTAEPVGAPEALSNEDLERDFGRRMVELYRRARDEADYNATYFLGMLGEIGPVATASRLMRSPTVSDGFASLWERGRLDLTVEAAVVDPKYREIFSVEDIEAAQARLEQFGYHV